jgi:hypothetical protein
MKLFYHFLVFVFVSLLLIACANIFTTDHKVKALNSEPSVLKRKGNEPDVSAKAGSKNGPYILAGFNYKNILKGKRWIDNQCDYKNNFYIKNIQLVISHFGQHR